MKSVEVAAGTLEYREEVDPYGRPSCCCTAC